MKSENQLLARIARALTGTKPEAEAAAPVDEVVEAVAAPEGVDTVVEAVVEAVVTEAETLELNIAAAVQPFATEVLELSTKLDELVTALSEMTAKYEGASSALAALVAEKELALVQAGITKMNARKVKVEAAIGTEKAPGLLAATEALDDTAFEAVVSALAGSVDAEAKTGLFQEVGATGEPDAAKIVEESAEMKILKAKYPGAK